MATSTVENYLKTIFQLDEDPGATASVGAIAEALEVTPGTVSSMMRHLSEEGLIDYVPRRKVSLLEDGRKQALHVVRRHRLIETFLVKIMKLDWSEVHEEAEVLEHVISDRLLRRMDEMLGFPSHDPHGDPIPNEAGEMEEDSEIVPLSELDSGRFRVVRVDDSDSGFLDWLANSGLLPGKKFSVSGRDRIAGILEISRDGCDVIRLGSEAASKLQVAVIS